MKRKILWCGLSFLLVAALVLASCAEEVPGEQEEEEEEVIVPGAPQYGGTLTILTNVSGGDPASADVADGFWLSTIWLGTIMDRPVLGDFEKYGPRGTNEYDFTASAYLPEQYIRGVLMESWEVTTEKITWHIRPGCYYQGRDVMENREYTADDCAYYLNYYLNSPPGKLCRGFIKGDVEVIDKYTVELTFDQFNLTWLFYLGYEDRASHVPHEVYELDASKWENQVGTGPWMFEEYVPGSHMSFLKNPIWWDTTTIDGVEYDDIPFIDKMVWPIIPDESTRVAALRTGMIDFYKGVPSPYWESLDATTPELLKNKYLGSGGSMVALRSDEAPFDNKNVRHAMMIGTDMEAFADLQGLGPLPIHWYPIWPGHPETLFTPLEKLPEEIQELYVYDPDKAIQMLEDEGYPAGDFKFKTDLYCTTSPANMDRAALLQDMWAKIGVEVNIVAQDPVTFDGYLRSFPRKYHGAAIDVTDTANPEEALLKRTTDHLWNWGCFSVPWYDEQVSEVLATVSNAERCARTKELALFVIEEATYVPLNPTMGALYWWPWLKNYYGESAVGDGSDFQPLMAKAWLDPDLKKEMGY